MELIKQSRMAEVKADIEKTAVVSKQLDALQVNTPDQYQEADLLLARVRLVHKESEAKLDALIKPFYEGLQGLYAFKKEVLAPLLLVQETAKKRMRDFKLLEAQRIEDERRAQEKERRRLEEEARKKEEAAATAKTAGMRKRLEDARAKLEEQAQEIAAAPAAVPTKAAMSSTRTVKKLKIVDIKAFLAAAQTDMRLRDYITIDLNNLHRAFKYQDVLWSNIGLEEYEDIQIVGR